ncbi:MAG: 50S ribosomal protein L9 [Candidatus Competibacteraceae bacterium]|nr:50S ribosomal protein L9 [Candidatus Competibacteraceae bacterium]
MEVILLQRVEHLGTLGDRVKVKSGYARNYLLPKSMAAEATEANIAKFEARRAELEKLEADQLSAAQSRAGRLADMVVTIPANAGNEGRLFGSVGPAEIASAVTAAGVEVTKREVLLNDGSIRQTGEYDVTLRLHSEVEATIRVNVVSA